MTTIIIGVITVATLAGVVSLALILRFLWRVYERGGRSDLTAAAKALRLVHDPNWIFLLGKLTGQTCLWCSRHGCTPRSSHRALPCHQMTAVLTATNSTTLHSDTTQRTPHTHVARSD
jgi:hypothetical protein